MADKIRILLVDDNPEFTRDEVHDRLYLPAGLARNFELIWIQDAMEARWLLDAFEILGIRSPGRLLEAGFPPEMLIFDYALTHSPPRHRTASDDTYRIERIQALAKEARISLPFAAPRDVPPPPYTGAQHGEDRMGCYIGGELARVFSAHPCGMVPTTAHIDTADTDAAFYQWLNEHFFMDLFDHKFRPRPTWKTLLPLAAESLQERIVQLAASGIIRLHLRTLQELVAETPDSSKLAVTIHSRFGRRTLPIEGLFIKYFFPGEPPHEKEFAAAAKKWACRVLEGLFAGHGQDAFFTAKGLAEQYFAAYLSEQRDDRYYLSELLAKINRSPSHVSDIEEICARLGLDAETVQTTPKSASIPPGVSMPNWKAASPNDVVARWVALMLAVRMEHEWRVGSELDAPPSAARSRVEKYLATSRPARGAARSKTKKTSVERSATVDDILEALDPLPQEFFTFRQKRKLKSGGLAKDITVLTNLLKHLGRAKSHGTLGLSLADVLADRPFNCGACQEALDRDEAPPVHEKSEWENCNHGIRKGEGLLLQIYADEIGFLEKEWPTWLIMAP